MKTQTARAGTRVAVGLLNKSMRVFDASSDGAGELGGMLSRCLCSFAYAPQKDSPKSARAVDWTGFDGGVTSVCFSEDGAYLAGAGGTCLLVVQEGESNTVLCRTPGLSAADGAGGTCRRLSDAAWCPENFGIRGLRRSCAARMLAALEQGRRGVCHIFDVCSRRDDRIPRRALPIASVEAPGKGPVTSLRFAFVRIQKGGGNEDGEEEGVLVLNRGGVATVLK